MAGQAPEATSVDARATAGRSIWVTFEADEIIELKRIAMDQDAQGAFELFERVVVPQVRERAQRLGMLLEDLGQEAASARLSR